MSAASEMDELAHGVDAAARLVHEPAPGIPRCAPALPRRGLTFAAALALFLLLSVALGLWVGRGQTGDASVQALFVGMRAQRVMVAFFAGAALALGGAIVQGLFRNPLASPEILGTNAGAQLGGKVALFATFVVFGGRPPWGVTPEMLVPLGCIAGALLALATVLTVSSLRASAVTLILTGFVLNGLFLSVGSFLSSVAQESFELQRAMSTFAAGSLSGVGSRQVLLAALLVLAGALPTLLYAGSLDVLLSGEEEASSLGVDVSRVRFWCVVWASLMSGAAVAVGGGVGFVGLVVPHLVRRFTGQNHRYLLPAVFVTGGGFLILCDALCRALPLAHEVPLSVLTELLGGPAFLYMLHRLGHESRHD